MEKRITPANIEELKWSLIAPKTRFTCGVLSTREIFETRKENMQITQMIWITKQPVIDFANNLYNPKALIMLFLN